jgi:hypothetical protein
MSDSNRKVEKQQKSKISGKKNSHLTEPVPLFNKASSDNVIEGRNNTFITLGRDRPSTLESGYGGAGFDKCGSVDIVSGRAAPFTRESDDAGEQVLVDNSIEFDAARITISQTTNVDSNFNICNRNSFPSDAESAVAAKADHIRVIGRKSLRLVTGTDKYDSNGNLISKLQGIELVAGNDDKDIQPMIKGDNLIEYLNKLEDRIRIHNSELIFIYSMLTSLLSALNTHTHISSPTGGPTTPSIELATTLPVIASQLALHTVDRQNETIKSTIQKETYLKPYGSKNIRSRLNKVN